MKDNTPAGSPLHEQLEDRLLFDAVPDQMPDMPEEPSAPASLEDHATVNAATDLAQETDPQARQEVVFVDRSVEGYEDLVAELVNTSSTDVVFLDTDTDGLQQIAAVLEDRDDIAAIHVISHGDEGMLRLGNTTLSADSIRDSYTDELSDIRDAITEDADILLYGCSLAGDPAGEDLLQTLSELTGADVAGSTDDTGAADRGGDWELEAEFGSVETESLTATAWDGLLAPAVDDLHTVERGNERVQSGNVTDNDTAVGNVNRFSINGAETAVTNAVAADFNNDERPTESTNAVATKYGAIIFGQDGSWNYAVDNSNPDILVLRGGSTLTDVIAYETADGSVAELRITINGNESFVPEQPQFFQTRVIGGVQKLSAYDPIAGVYTDFADVPVRINAAAYNPTDNYLYASASSTGFDSDGAAISNGDLLRIDRLGRTHVLRVTDASGGRAIGEIISAGGNSGDFDDEGNYWGTGGKVDLRTGERTSYYYIGDSTTLGGTDLVFSNGRLYSYTGSVLRYADIAGATGTTATITEIDVTALTVEGGTLPTGGSWGAAWTDADGRLYFGHNGGAIWELKDVDTALPRMILRASGLGGTSSNDGASDQDAPSPFAAPAVGLGGTAIDPYEATFTEGDAPVHLFDTSTLAIRDLDNDTGAATDSIQALQLQFNSLTDGADEIVYVGTSQILLNADASFQETFGTTTFDVTYDVASGRLQFASAAGGDMLITDTEDLLRSLTYENTSQHPSEQNRGVIVSVTDVGGTKVRALSVIIVDGVNDDPVATDDALTIAQGSTNVALDLLDNDTDAEDIDPGDGSSDPVRISLNSIRDRHGNDIAIDGTAKSIAVNGGTLNVAADNSVTFTPDADFEGTVRFSYELQDSDGGTDRADVSIVVSADTDGDGILNVFDIDDDNDGITDSDEGASDIEWLTFDGLDLNSGESQVVTVTTSSGRTVNVTVSVTGSTGVTAQDVNASRPASEFPQLGGNPGLETIVGKDAYNDFTLILTFDQDVQLLMTDGEASRNGEPHIVTTDGSNWEVHSTVRPEEVVIDGVGTDTVTFDGTDDDSYCSRLTGRRQIGAGLRHRWPRQRQRRGRGLPRHRQRQ